VPQKVLDAAQLVVRLARHRELHLVVLGRQRGHDRTLRRQWTALDCRRHVINARLRRTLRRRCLWCLRHRKLAHRWRHRRLWAQARNQVLDVPLALVACGLQNFAMVVRGQMRRQQTDGCQGDGSSFKQRQNDRKPPRGASGLDPPISGML